MKKEIPILMGTPMVQATRAGRKTKTRRTRALNLINQNPDDWKLIDVFAYVGKFEREQPVFRFQNDFAGCFVDIPSPWGKPGDLLWVRESFAITYASYPPLKRKVWYKADNPTIPDRVSFKWKPSIHMPKGSCRIWLEVESVGVERLHDISPNDAGAEGVEYWNVDAEAFEGGELVADYKNYMWRDDESYEDYYSPTYANPVLSFKSLWQKINGEESWNQNPWVWVVSFKVLSTTGKPSNL